MAAVTIPLLNMRHNGPRGVGAAGLPLKSLRQFQVPPPDLLAAEKKKLAAEKVKLVKELRTGAMPLRSAAAPPRCRAAPLPPHALRLVHAFVSCLRPLLSSQTRTSMERWECRPSSRS